MEEQTHWIKPRNRLQPTTLTLPACEQIGVNMLMRRLECFLTDASISPTHLISCVQTAMSAVLEEIPYLAGRIALDDKTKLRQLIISSDPKVQLKVVHHPDINAKALDDKFWPPHALNPAKFCLSFLPSSGVGSHVFGLQLNILDGGLVLGFEFNHIVADGVARSQCMYTLAHHLKIAINGDPHQPLGLVKQASLDKSIAYGTHPARPLLEWTEDWKQKPPTSPDAMSREKLVAYYQARIANMSLSIWHIPPEMMEKLRDIASDPSSKEPRMSRMSCVAALIWRSVAKARSHSPSTTTTLLTPVQARGRVPEMPLNWVGNAILYARAHATASELDTLTFADLGRRIKHSVAAWTAPKIREYWGSIEDCKNLDELEPIKNTDLGTAIELSSVADMKSSQGQSWGRGLHPRSSRFPSLAITDGYCVVWPRLATGGIEIFAYLSRDTLKKLAADPDFRRFVEYRAASDIAIDDLVAEHSPKPQARL